MFLDEWSRQRNSRDFMKWFFKSKLDMTSASSKELLCSILQELFDLVTAHCLSHFSVKTNDLKWSFYFDNLDIWINMILKQSGSATIEKISSDLHWFFEFFEFVSNKRTKSEVFHLSVLAVRKEFKLQDGTCELDFILRANLTFILY